MLFDSDFLLIVESKRLLSLAKNESVIKDIQRLHRKDHITSLRNRFQKPLGAPKKALGLIIAEHWEERSSSGDLIEWWLGRPNQWDWKRDGYPEHWTYGSVEVMSYPAQNKKETSSVMHWLYCFGELD